MSTRCTPPAHLQEQNCSIVVDVVTAVSGRDEVMNAQGDPRVPWSSVDDDVLDLELNALAHESFSDAVVSSMPRRVVCRCRPRWAGRNTVAHENVPGNASSKFGLAILSGTE